MKIAIAGSSGFVGQLIGQYLISKNDTVIPINRADFSSVQRLVSKINGTQALINCTGAPIIGKFITQAYKQQITDSRILTTRLLVQALDLCTDKPEVFIQTSAIGIYNNTKVHDEYSDDFATDFLGRLVIDWEQQAFNTTNKVRLCVVRLGVVLDRSGGMLKQVQRGYPLLLLFFGNGLQAFSFITSYDLKRAFHFLINNRSATGIFNLTAPTFTTQRTFNKLLKQHSFFLVRIRIPDFIIKFLFKENATLLTDGQKVIPKRLIDLGFRFKFPTIHKAMNYLFG